MDTLSNDIEAAYNAILPYTEDGAQIERETVFIILGVLVQWKIRAEALEKEINGAHELIDLEETLRRRELAKRAEATEPVTPTADNVVAFPARKAVAVISAPAGR